LPESWQPAFFFRHYNIGESAEEGVAEFMKKIECYIQEDRIQAVVDALIKTGVGGVTVYPVQGFGRQQSRGKKTLMPKMKIEIVALDLEADHVLAAILKATRQGKFGDGKIVILPVSDVIRIRTGEKGAKALF